MHPEISDPEIGRTAMRKAMWRIVPLILLAYIIAYIDRVNVSFAALQMNDDLEFSATTYGLGAGLFFLSYALLEVPSSLMLRRFSPPQWIARIMITWGLLAAGMMFVQTPMQFYAMRFLLGAAEAGFFPCVVYYLSCWFPMAWRGRALSRMYIAAPLGSVVLGSISAALLELDGVASLHGWQWLFLAQGLPAVFIGLAVLWLLPRTPDEVRWLTDPERRWIQRELARNANQVSAPLHHNILALLGNPFVVLLGLMGLLGNAAAIGLILTAPTVLSIRAGVDTQAIGHLVTAGGVIGVVVILFVGWNSDRHGDRLREAAICSSIMMIGLFLIAVAPTPPLVMTGYLLVVGSGFAGGVMQVAAWGDVLHPLQLAVSGAAINTLWQIGSFLSPYAFGLARDATGSYTLALVGSAVLAGAQVALILYVRARVRVNRQGPAVFPGSNDRRMDM